MIIYSILLTLLTVVTFYLGYRVKVIRGYKEQYYGLETVYETYKMYLLVSVIVTTLVGLIGYLYLFT